LANTKSPIRAKSLNLAVVSEDPNNEEDTAVRISNMISYVDMNEFG